MRTAGCRLAGGALVLLVAAGCGSRLHYEKTVELAPGTLPLVIDGPSRDQKVVVKASAPGTPLTVYCYLKKDENEAERAAFLNKASDKILAKSDKGEEAALECTVPAGQEFVVLLRNHTRNKVSVHVTIEGR
jgi:hypothetical protein